MSTYEKSRSKKIPLVVNAAITALSVGGGATFSLRGADDESAPSFGIKILQGTATGGCSVRRRQAGQRWGAQRLLRLPRNTQGARLSSTVMRPEGRAGAAMQPRYEAGPSLLAWNVSGNVED
jgi:hypothetical protein